jgi:PAS domain S-box/diguanylate cyclase (GGDEF) domain
MDKMVEQFAQDFIRHLPFGYACYRLILNEAGQPADCVFLDANSAFERDTGLQAERLKGKKLSELFPESQAGHPDWTALFTEAAVSGNAKELSWYSEGLGRWFNVTVFSPQKDSVVTMIQDITEKKEALSHLARHEEELKSAHEELEFIFNSTQDAMFLAEYKDEEIYYLRINSAHQKLSEFSRGDVKGKTPVELWGQRVGGPLREKYLEGIHTDGGITYEEFLDLPGGRKFFLTSLTTVRENGKPKYLIGSRKDMTEYKKLEKDHSALLHRLESMFNEHIAIMLIIDPVTGKILDANPSACEFYGYSKREILDLYIQDINMLPAEEVGKQRSLAFQRQEGHFIFPHRLKSGEIRLVDVYSCPIESDEGTSLYSIIFDVTDRETFKEDLYREKELLSTTLKSIGDGVVTTDVGGRITSLNKAAEEIMLWSSEEVAGKLFSDVFVLKSEVTGEPVENPVAKVLQTGKVIGLANHTVLIDRSGKAIPIADSAAPIRGEDGHTLGIVMVFRDVRTEKIQQDKILFLSYHDPLTGLYNRRFIETEIKKLDVQGLLPVSVIMGDVNGLKIANDVFSHETGDRLLQKVSDTLRGNCGRDDTVARWGGDEFLILRPHATLEDSERLIQKVKKEFAEKSEGALQLSVSLGCAVKSHAEEPLHQVIQQAEEWMYHQKLLEGKSYRNSIINTLLATLYEKSMETEEHAQRLIRYCQEIGKKLGFSDEVLNELSLLAVLHDIGKVGIHQSVLQKPGPLSPEEWKEMERHPEIGYRIAQNTPELVNVSEYILSHHERWDGTGYPRGLKGEEIPLNCRILAVADAYDAMTNDRVYRKALSRGEAMEELARNAGTQFDPGVVKIFIGILSQEQEPSDGKSGMEENCI